MKMPKTTLLEGFFKTVCEGGRVLALIQSEHFAALAYACLDLCLGDQVIATVLVILCNVFL